MTEASCNHYIRATAKPTAIILDLETRTLDQPDLTVRKPESGRYHVIAIEPDRQLYCEYIGSSLETRSGPA